MSENQRLRRVCAMLLHRLGGYVHLVRADMQATAGKYVTLSGRLGESVMLELKDYEGRKPGDDEGGDGDG